MRFFAIPGNRDLVERLRAAGVVLELPPREEVELPPQTLEGSIIHNGRALTPFRVVAGQPVPLTPVS